MRRALAWVVLGGLVFMGCRKAPVDHPVDAYLSFTRTAERDQKAAYESLSKKTQQVLAAKAKELSDASGGTLLNEPSEIFFSRHGRPSPVGDVKLIEQNADSARISVTSDGKTQQVKMVREDSRWRVDLSDVVAASTEAAAQ